MIPEWLTLLLIKQKNHNKRFGQFEFEFLETLMSWTSYMSNSCFNCFINFIFKLWLLLQSGKPYQKLPNIVKKCQKLAKLAKNHQKYQFLFCFLFLTEEILGITAVSDQGSYAKPLWLRCKHYHLTLTTLWYDFVLRRDFFLLCRDRGSNPRQGDLSSL